jgi:hypothetical protein
VRVAGVDLLSQEISLVRMSVPPPPGSRRGGGDSRDHAEAAEAAFAALTKRWHNSTPRRALERPAPVPVAKIDRSV